MSSQSGDLTSSPSSLPTLTPAGDMVMEVEVEAGAAGIDFCHGWNYDYNPSEAYVGVAEGGIIIGVAADVENVEMEEEVSNNVDVPIRPVLSIPPFDFDNFYLAPENCQPGVLSEMVLVDEEYHEYLPIQGIDDTSEELNSIGSVQQVPALDLANRIHSDVPANCSELSFDSSSMASMDDGSSSRFSTDDGGSSTPLSAATPHAVLLVTAAEMHLMSSALDGNDRPPNGAPIVPVPASRHLQPASSVLLGLYRIPEGVWRKACEATDTVESSKILFTEMFTDEEMLTSTLSGRKKTLKLDRSKLYAIIRAVDWIFWMPRPVDALCYDYLQEVPHALDPTDVNNIEQQVFTSFRSELAKKILKRKR